MFHGLLFLLKTGFPYVGLLTIGRRKPWTETEHLTAIFGEPAVSQAPCWEWGVIKWTDTVPLRPEGPLLEEGIEP